MTTGKSGVTHDSPDKHITPLIDSAFEFLERAVREFSESPKFSTIHFATAVELFLKARLMAEHWSLVADEPGTTSRRSFLEGTAKTVSSGKAIIRLAAIAGVTIPDQAIKAFETISDHRNRMIHFVHSEASAPENDQTVRQIAAEQSLGWYHLARLLKEWKETFWLWDERIVAVEQLMRGHREYLKATFKGLQPEISRLKEAGKRLSLCVSCGHQSAVVESITDKLETTNCLVCKREDALITLECPDPDCGKESVVAALQSEQPVCANCSHVFDGDDFVIQLDTSSSDDWDTTPINCAVCSSPASVVEHHQKYICSECRAIEDEAYSCAWCNERQIGGDNLDNSYWRGCEFCAGKSGWDKG